MRTPTEETVNMMWRNKDQMFNLMSINEATFYNMLDCVLIGECGHDGLASLFNSIGIQDCAE